MTSFWTAPEIERSPSPKLCSEREALQGWLGFHRQTLLHGAPAASPRAAAIRSVPPSSLSLLGLVRHMAEVEAWWFRTMMGWHPAHGFYGPGATTPEGDFTDLDAVPCRGGLGPVRRGVPPRRRAVADLPARRAVHLGAGQRASRPALDLPPT